MQLTFNCVFTTKWFLKKAEIKLLDIAIVQFNWVAMRTVSSISVRLLRPEIWIDNRRSIEDETEKQKQSCSILLFEFCLIVKKENNFKIKKWNLMLNFEEATNKMLFFKVVALMPVGNRQRASHHQRGQSSIHNYSNFFE